MLSCFATVLITFLNKTDTENNEGIGYPTAGLTYKIHPFSHSVKHGYSKPLGPAKNSSLYQT